MNKIIRMIFPALFLATSLHARSLDSVQSFLYQLQDINLTQIQQSDFDLIVMDYSSDGSGEGAYSKPEIQAVRNSGDKIVLAYLSIGEAEDYRFYWQESWASNPPAWLDEENPDWEGNYKVKFWVPEWQTIILQYLKKIQSAGFDGVYLDLVDAYESYAHLSSVQAWKEMAGFVSMISDSAKQNHPGFLVFVQNASDLGKLSSGYISKVDGIGQEDLFYGYDGDGVKTPTDETDYLESNLDLFLEAGKTVFSIDYPFANSENTPHFDTQTVAKIRDAYDRSRAKGYVPFCAVRNLNHFTINPGHRHTFHVDMNHPSANDDNPGTSDLPWETVTHAAAQAEPGDTIQIHPGVYEEVELERSGTDSAWITFRGTNQDSVTIPGFTFNESVSNVHLTNVSGYPVWGVYLEGENHYIALTNLDVSGGDDGIHMTLGYSGEEPYHGRVSHITIENCRIHDSHFSGINGTPGPCDTLVMRNLEVFQSKTEGEGFGMDGIAIEKGTHILVEDCVVHDMSSDGIDLNSRDFDGFAENIIVRRNLVYRNHQNGIKLWSGGRLENNAIWGQGNAAVVLDRNSGVYEMINNTIAYNMWDTTFAVRNWGMVVSYDAVVPCSLTLANNIFAFNSNDNMGGPTGIFLGEEVVLNDEGNNLFWSRDDNEIQAEFIVGNTEMSRSLIQDGTWAALSGFGSGDQCADPLFVSGWPDVDLHLREGSLAIDHGKSFPDLREDLEKRPRPFGETMDIGAYEYQEGTKIGVKFDSQKPDEYQLLCNYPNPFNQSTMIYFRLDTPGKAILKIYDIRGREVLTLAEPDHTAGWHSVPWNASGCSSGMYICRMIAGKQVKKSIKMILLE